MLPSSPSYTKPGHSCISREIDTFLPLSLPEELIRWDGQRGSSRELMANALATIKTFANDKKPWVDLGRKHGVHFEYHTEMTVKGNGNRFFRLRAVCKVPPQLFCVAVLEPTIIGNIDATVRHVRVLKNFEDGKSRLVALVAAAGPRPLFLDRDECALTGYSKDEDGVYWQYSCTCPSHLPSVKSAVRDHTMYWGYKLEPFPSPTGDGKTHTRVTLISQTEIFGWLPKFIVNRAIPTVLSDYIGSVEAHLLEMIKRGAPARALVESYGLTYCE